ncbi:MAG: type II toxin-antitoxin system VapC family toxin [Chitinivibrionales bacterium]|nr:type II toxin-antitoxin system VapC family toxin [Chitinivibrionales bacterium]
MKALDTNALVRFLVRDDEKQAQVVKKILLNAEVAGDLIFIPFIVMLETIWVLSSVYEYSRAEIILALENLLVVSVFEIEEHERVVNLCRIAKKHSIDLADLLIGLTSHDKGCETTLTFDKKAAQSELFTLI